MDESIYNLAIVFEKTGNYNFGTITITPRSLRILAIVDGKKNIAEIKEEVGLSYEEVYHEIQSLHDLNLVEMVDTAPLFAVEEKVKAVNYRGTSHNIVKISSRNNPTRPSYKPKNEFYRGNSYRVMAEA